jgi:hypothetical protein
MQLDVLDEPTGGEVGSNPPEQNAPRHYAAEKAELNLKRQGGLIDLLQQSSI